MDLRVERSQTEIRKLSRDSGQTLAIHPDRKTGSFSKLTIDQVCI
jgi:hypothetical protein